MNQFKQKQKIYARDNNNNLKFIRERENDQIHCKIKSKSMNKRIYEINTE